MVRKLRAPQCRGAWALRHLISEARKAEKVSTVCRGWDLEGNTAQELARTLLSILSAPDTEGGGVVMLKTIKLQAPKARVGDAVRVSNYRRAGKPWEDATVLRVTYSEWLSPGFGLSYDVYLDRRATSGRYLHLTVGNDAIELREG